jgi:hypothetical protein
LAAKAQYQLRTSYADFCKQAVSASTAKQFGALKPLVKSIVKDVLDRQKPGSAVASAFDAVCGLVAVNGSAAVDYLCGLGVVLDMVKRLSAASESVAQLTFKTLAVMAPRCTARLLPQIEGAVPALYSELSNAAVPQEVFLEGALLVAVLCQRGPESIDRLTQAVPRLCGLLFASMVQPTDYLLHNLLRCPLLTPHSANSASALMYIALLGNASHLKYTLDNGLYTLAFKVLEVFGDNPMLVLKTLQVLRRILRDVKMMQQYLDTLQEFRADVAWGRVRALTHAPSGGPQEAISSHNAEVSATDSSTDGAGEEDGAVTERIRKQAVLLYNRACEDKLVPSTFEP